MMKKLNYLNSLKSLHKFTFKSFSLKILNPNSLIFAHKKETDKYQKFLSRMRPPFNIAKKTQEDESDFLPGLKYFTKNKEDFKFFCKSDRRSHIQSSASYLHGKPIWSV
jgi:hypothetical protein